MSTYKEINGQKVQNVSSDPPSPYIGQVWYNTTSRVLKFNSGTLVQSWSTKNNLPNARKDTGAAGLTYNAGLAFGGNLQPPGTKTAVVESWNGTNWTSQTAMPSNRWRNGGTGSSTAALSSGGDSPTGAGVDTVDSYNGSWTNQTALPSNKRSMGSTGTSTNALVFGGGPDGPPQENATYSYNGSWTAQPNMVGDQRQLAAAGASSTDALAFGGYDQPGSPSQSKRTQIYNGTWTQLADMNSGRPSLAGSGTTTSALASGGNPSATESWNGTSWTTMPNLNTQREALQGVSATNTQATVFGGEGSTGSATEEFTNNELGIKTITTS
jgi:hypothetical protein